MKFERKSVNIVVTRDDSVLNGNSLRGDVLVLVTFSELKRALSRMQISATRPEGTMREKFTLNLCK